VTAGGGEDADERAAALRAHLDRVLIGGPQHRAIVIVGYSPDWPRRYDAERDRITAALGVRAREVHHIGSTSVPGLAAKPIIDIALGVDDVEHEGEYGPALESAGYVPRVREPGHRMYRTPELDVHLHIFTVGDPEIRSHRLFRDWLRRSPGDRAAYARVKRDLAARDWEDMNFYAEAKTEIIAEITDRARRWAGESGWT
jgi:GrpB-like predicted nucleotidyltransferase (UPF0157 family)